MNRTVFGRFGLHLDRREPDGIWVGASRVAWLGIATLCIGRYTITATWPVRFAA